MDNPEKLTTLNLKLISTSVCCFRSHLEFLAVNEERCGENALFEETIIPMENNHWADNEVLQIDCHLTK
jgi:hypothetical protein